MAACKRTAAYDVLAKQRREDEDSCTSALPGGDEALEVGIGRKTDARLLAAFASALLFLFVITATGCAARAGESAGPAEASKLPIEFSVWDACTSEPVVGATIEVVSKADCARTVVAHTDQYGEATATVESDAAMILVCAKYFDCVSVEVLPGVLELPVNLPRWSIR